MPLPYWYWEKQVIENKTPSIEAGLDYATECKYRKEGARFILDSGKVMNLGYETLATGVVFFHRFYMFHSFKTFPPHVTACCCLFLAGKVEETPKRCRDIIKTAKSLLNEEKFATFGLDPVEEVMAMERILLQTIKFDLKVQHPYFFLKKYIKCIKGSKEILQEVLQMAWNFVNDSLCTTLSIEWEPEIIAIAVIHLAGKLCKLKVLNWTGRLPEHSHWWDMFVQDLSIELLEDICHQILDLYSSKDKQSSIFFNITQSIKSAANSNASESSINSNSPQKEVKPETTPPFNHPQASIAETPKPPPPPPPTWTPVTSFPPMPPPENSIHPPFPLPNLTVPPPSPYPNVAMPPSPFPMTNLSVPPPSFPTTNLSVPPPPMINSTHYYGPEQYAR